MRLIEPLEDRCLLSTYSLSDALSAFNSASSALDSSQQELALANQALGTNISIPLVSQSLSSALGLSTDLQAPFQKALSGASWSSVVSALPAGFTVVTPFTGTPDASGNLFVISYAKTYPTPSALFTASGDTGFSYLDSADSATGGLLGGITTQVQSIGVQMTLGVDVQNSTVGFFLGTASALTVNGISATGSLGGTLDLGSLGSVAATATATLSIPTAGLTFTNPHGDGKLRIGDFSTTSLPVTGTITGAISIGATLKASLTLLPGAPTTFSWSPTFTGTIDSTGFHTGTVNLNPPSPTAILSSLGGGLLSLGGSFLSGGGGSILGPLGSALDQPLPLIDQSIDQLTGLENDLPQFPSLSLGSADPNVLISDLEGAGFVVAGKVDSSGKPDATLSDVGTMIDDLINGTKTDIISWSDSGSVPLVNLNETIPVTSLGIPDIASAEIDATFGVNATLKYDVGFGVNSHGFYLDTGNLVSLSFNANAGIKGQVEVLGFPLADAGGALGFSTNPYISLTAPSYSANPNRVYLGDLSAFGSNPIDDFFDALGAGISGDLTGNAYAKIDLYLFSVSWNWKIDNTVFNYQKTPTWPALPGAPAAGKPSPFTQSGGTLTFTGTTGNETVNLASNAGVVTATYDGTVLPTQFTGVTSFNFIGGNGNDRLTTSPGFNIPITATSHDTASQTTYFQGGGGGNTLTGGAGSDTLIGGAGNDSITGGSGTTLIMGNDGHDQLTAGAGSTQIIGGTGASTLIGGSGQDSIYAGGGNDLIHGGSGTYFIDGGAGNDTIDGDTGGGIIHAGSGHDVITGGAASSEIFGDGGSDTVMGGAGDDKIYAGTGGNSVIHGGAGDDTIYGGGAGDQLYGDAGNNTIYGGPGNETLCGGDGQNLAVNALGNGLLSPAGDGANAGSNLLIAGPGNDLLYGDSSGHNTLTAGAGNDTLFAGTGGDYLDAGTGVDALYGGPANDTLQLSFFTPAAQTPDILVGGPGFNTVILKPASGTSQPAPGELTSAVTNTATQLFVTDAAVVTSAQIAAGYVVTVDDEQMRVTAATTTALSGSIVSGSDVVTGLSSTSQLFAGEPVSGTGIPTGSTIASIVSGTSITLSGNSLQTTTSSLSFPGGTLTVQRAQGGSQGVAHSAGALVGPPALSVPGNYYINFDSTPTPNQYEATLYTLGANSTEGAQIGQTAFTMPSDIEQVALEGGPGNNVIRVDPSVTRDMYLYGGPGDNTLMAGSGSDTLVGGPGSSLLEGGSGDDVLYGGDQPAQDAKPQLDASGTLTTHTQAPGANTLIAGAGNDELYAGPGNDVLIGGSAIQQNGRWVLTQGAGRDVFTGGAGHDLMIAGPGSPGAIMFGGANNDVMVGDNNGQDIFEGGTAPYATGNLSAGSSVISGLASTAQLAVGESVGQTATGSWIPAGTTISAINSSSSITLSNPATLPPNYPGGDPTTLTGTSLAFGGNLLLGGNLNDILTGGGGNDTIVGGSGSDELQAGSAASGGNQVLYGTPQTASWMQAEALARADHVVFAPPVSLSGAITGVTTLASNVVSKLLTTGGLSIGESITGAGIPAGATISSIVSASAITISNQATSSSSAQGEQLIVGNPLQEYNQLLAQQIGLQPLFQPLDLLSVSAQSAGTTAGSNIVAIPVAAAVSGNAFSGSNAIDTGQTSLSNVEPGQWITGPGIPSGTIIAAVVAPQTINQTHIDGEIVLSQNVIAGSSGNTFDLSDQLSVGQTVTDGGVVPAGAFITSIISPTAIMISAPALLTETAASLAIGLTSQQTTQLQAIKNQLAAIGIAETQIASLGSVSQNLVVNCIIGGAGNDQLYGSPSATQLVGGAGATTFYNYSTQDTVQGGSSGDNTLMLQGDGAITVKQDTSNVNAIDVAIPGQNSGQPWVVGNVGNISHIQYLGVQMLSGGTDSVTVEPAAAGGRTGLGNLQGLYVQAGSGTDTLDVTQLNLPSTLVGGSGADTFRISTPVAGGSAFVAGTGADELDVTTLPGDTVSVAASNGVTTLDDNGTSYNIPGGFQKVVIIGGSGGTGQVTDTLSGSAPGVVLEGGSGSNVTNDLTESGGTATLLGGSGANNYFEVEDTASCTIIGAAGGSAAAVNQLTFVSDFNLTLNQIGSTIFYIGNDSAGMATNITGLEVEANGFSQRIDASGMTMPVQFVLNDGFDTVLGGAGNDLFTATGITDGDVIDGGGGIQNVIVLNSPPFSFNFQQPLQNIEFYELASDPFIQHPVAQFPVDMSTPVISNDGSVPSDGQTSAVVTVEDQNSSAALRPDSIDWGDGSAEQVIQEPAVSPIQQTFSHIYAADSTYLVTETYIDPIGAAAVETASFTGGLKLQANGELDSYFGSVPTEMDQNVQSFVVDNAQWDVAFSLHKDGTVYSLSGGAGSSVPIDANVQSMFVGPAGDAYFLHPNHLLYELASSNSVELADSQVQTLLSDKSGTLYKLDTNGDLYDETANDTTWTLARQDVQSIALTSNHSAIDVVETNGNYSQFDGTTWTLLAGAQLKITPLSSVTASASQAVTVTVVDGSPNPLPVTAYTGTVQLTSSDAASGIIPAYTYTATDAGAHTFDLTLTTAGKQTITAAASGLSTVQTPVTVIPGAATSLAVSVPSASININSSSAFTVTALDPFGNVATAFTGPVSFTSSDPVAVLPGAYSFISADQGSHTFTATFKTAGGISATATGGALSGAADLDVAQSASTTTLKKSTTTAVDYGQSVTFTATLAAGISGIGLPTGVVTFEDGSTALGIGTLSNGVATFVTKAMPAGSNSITAVYAGDTNFTASTSGALTQTVTHSATTTTLTKSINAQIKFGQPVTFTATLAAVSPGAGTPTGTVTFQDGSTVLGTGTLSNGVATLTSAAIPVGSNSIKAIYGGDANFTTSTSGSVSQTVNQAASTTTVTGASSVFGQSVTLTATVAPVAPSIGIPTGTVTFEDGSAVLGTGTLGGGIATFSTSSLLVGGHSITAIYGGSASFSTSTSSVFAQIIAQSASTTKLSKSTTTAIKYGQPVTFTATLAAVSPGVGTPTGTVTFEDGATPLGTGTLSGGIATLTTTTLPAQSNSVTAVYGGDTDFTTSTSSALTQTVTQTATTTTLTKSTTTSVKAGQPVTFTATLAAVAPGAGTPTGTVTFEDGSTVLGTGTLSNGLATLTSTAIPVGSNSIKAVYGGDPNFTTSTSGTVSQTVNQAASTTTVTGAAGVLGQSVTFTATVSPVAPSVAAPTGTVTFEDGSTVLGTGTLSGGIATFAASSLSLGGHSITAIYGGSANFTSSTSSPFVETIRSASAATLTKSTTTVIKYGQTVTFTATLAAVSPATGTPSGTVTFEDGSTVLGTGTLINGVATFTTITLPAGSNSVKAVYNGDTNFAASTSNSLSQTVSQSTTTTTLTKNTTTSIHSGQPVTFTATLAAVSPGAGTPTGIVTFEDGSTALGTGTLVSGVATFGTTTLPVGSNSVKAIYGGDANFTTSTSNSLTQTVD